MTQRVADLESPRKCELREKLRSQKIAISSIKSGNGIVVFSGSDKEDNTQVEQFACARPNKDWICYSTFITNEICGAHQGKKRDSK